MKVANRCPDCGGVADTYLVGIMGDTYYRCSQGLTSLTKGTDGKLLKSRIVPCEVVIDQTGNKVTGTIAYVSEGKVRTMSFTEGKG